VTPQGQLFDRFSSVFNAASIVPGTSVVRLEMPALASRRLLSIEFTVHTHGPGLHDGAD
jgi:hypothetical protein